MIAGKNLSFFVSQKKISFFNLRSRKKLVLRIFFGFSSVSPMTELDGRREARNSTMIDDFVTDNPRHCDGFRQPDNLIIKFLLETLLSARSRCE